MLVTRVFSPDPRGFDLISVTGLYVYCQSKRSRSPRPSERGAQLRSFSHFSSLCSYKSLLLALIVCFCSFYSCYEDDEPPCPEEIQYSSCSDLFGAIDLDAEVNANMSGTEDDEGKNERRRADRKSHLLPHFLQQDALETLSIRSGQCNSVDISNRYFY